MSVLVDVVVVNWNSRDLLRGCLLALGRSRDASRLSAIVVDNASTDGSAEDLVAGPAAVTLLRNGANRGFGAACNQGAAEGAAPFVLFLNPDAAVGPDAVEAAARFLADHPAAGIVGVRLVDESGRTMRSTAREPTPRRLAGQALGLDRIAPGIFPPHFVTEWDHADTRPVEQVMGAFLMIRRNLFDALGGFDERFFVYFEDVDLCARARKAGFSAVHLAGPSVVHEGGGTSRQVRDRRLFYFLRSKALYVAKHHGRGFALAQVALDLLGHVPIRMAAALAGGAPGEAAAAARAGWWLCRALPETVRLMAR